MPNPYAAYDCLSVISRTQELLGDVTVSELHLLPYLGCLLSLYRCRPTAEWGYGFISSRDGSPFSSEITDAADRLCIGGYLMRTEHNSYRSTPAGDSLLLMLVGLSENAEREQYIRGACDSVISLPIGAVRRAVMSERTLHVANQLQSTRLLLQETATDQLYEEFQVLSHAVGVEIQRLGVPAVIWLGYQLSNPVIDGAHAVNGDV